MKKILLSSSRPFFIVYIPLWKTVLFVSSKAFPRLPPPFCSLPLWTMQYMEKSCNRYRSKNLAKTHLDSSSFSSLSPSPASGRFKYSLSACSISLSSSSSDSSVKLNYFKKAILLISNCTNISINPKFLPILYRMTFSLIMFKRAIWRKTLKLAVFS